MHPIFIPCCAGTSRHERLPRKHVLYTDTEWMASATSAGPAKPAARGLVPRLVPAPPVRLRHSPCTRESRVGPALAADLKKGEANEITTVSQPGTSRLLPRQERQHDRTSVVLLSGAGTGRNGAEPVRKHLVQSAVHAQARLRYIGAQLPHDASQV